MQLPCLGGLLTHEHPRGVLRARIGEVKAQHFEGNFQDEKLLCSSVAEVILAVHVIVATRLKTCWSEVNG